MKQLKINVSFLSYKRAEGWCALITHSVEKHEARATEITTERDSTLRQKETESKWSTSAKYSLWVSGDVSAVIKTH